jgi:hypothetical protein
MWEMTNVKLAINGDSHESERADNPPDCFLHIYNIIMPRTLLE